MSRPPTARRARLPAPPLYDPSDEHDGCGVGFIASLDGQASHDIVEHAVSAIRRVAHRGAVAADARTGDGAGLMLGVPQPLFRAELERLTRLTPPPGPIGVGMFFLPRRSEPAYSAFKSLAEEVLLRRGLTRFVWRRVPTDDGVLGELAMESRPEIEQLLVAFAGDLEPVAVDRTLYATRKEIQARVTRTVNRGLYIASFSCRTVVYKGLMTSTALADFYPDLRNPAFTSAFAIFHQRYSTNTVPDWNLAQPFRTVAHNGEINTIAANRNWTRARESDIGDAVWGDELEHLKPVIPEGASDSAGLDNVHELLTLSGRPAHHAMAMLIPEAFGAHAVFNEQVRAFFEYHECLSEPWDGPAAVVFSDGELCGACLDRTGLRPARYEITDDGLIVLGSEVGLVELDEARVIEKGRLGPGNMLVVDLAGRRLLRGKQIKQELASRKPYGEWVESELLRLSAQPVRLPTSDQGEARLAQLQLCFGYSSEELTGLFPPMALEGKDPVGSMGTDSPLAVLSARPRLLSDFFKQRFAQVTNPPIDSIRERAVMTLGSNLGRRRDWLSESPEHARQVRLESPIISCAELDLIAERLGEGRIRTLSLLSPRAAGVAGLRERLDELCFEAVAAAKEGCELLVLSDRGVGPERCPLPILLAVGAVNAHLLRVGLRLRLSLIADSGEPRDVHQFATLIGYGAGAINPWLAWRNVDETLPDCSEEERAARLERYREAVENGLLKVMAKMGISVLGSYRGAQIFEAVGVGRGVISRCFVGTPSRLRGIGLAEILSDALSRHQRAFSATEPHAPTNAGLHRFRKGGEPHAWSPKALRALVDFRKAPGEARYRSFASAAREHPPLALRDLLEPRLERPPVPIAEVEGVASIRKRFSTAAMSLGSLSPEVHEDLAIAMNRIGAKSNTGEGGEDPERFRPLPSGASRNSAIKQVASARFGVTAEYLAHAVELEIKIAQGSKPGEGGQLPGHKVTPLIARLRRATPGVTLISPPPHHDIYSIEDLAQLIHDLKQVNPEARICVKLVSEAGIGTIAAGVVKAGADIIHVSGHDGGTGASPLSSIHHAGAPWELGLAEVQQVLIMNQLRERVTLRVDGGLRSGRDVLIGVLLGADEFTFGTSALVALGCRYVRSCHLNNCPVGIATQDPELRKRYDGRPEMLIAYLDGLAGELREGLAQMGFHSIDEAIGRAELLRQVRSPDRPRANLLDLSPLLSPAPESAPRRRLWERNQRPPEGLEDRLIRHAEAAIESQQPVRLHYRTDNSERSTGARLAGAIARRYGEVGLPPATVEIGFVGSAGQSFGAFCVKGMKLHLEGQANDYVAKGMNGGEVIIVPPRAAARDAAKNVILGNTVLYGATGGLLFARGSAGERFCVRNSGASCVVEGVGDHGCEYMTGGVAVILGRIGRNFGAGMTGGVAFVLDERDHLRGRINEHTLAVSRVENAEDAEALRALIEQHQRCTGSERARRILSAWSDLLPRFWKLYARPGDQGAQEREDLEPSVPLVEDDDV